MLEATWPIPILLAVTSVLGLVAALTGDGWRDAIAWLALALPILAIILAITRATLARRT